TGKWDEISDAYFLKDAGNNVLTLSETNVDAIYELHKGYGADPRRLNGYVRDGGDYYFRKFALTGSATARNYPLIRMTEAYYIAAECLKNTDPARAVELLETVRGNRQIEESLGTLSADEIQTEVYKEYRKEFIGESQLFYYYKRLNASQIEGTNARPDKSLYVLPVPSNDVEFGGYAN
ncbi:MAG: RagB/SusD family nutrient uptake outer membrane protein, partial [Odoribacter sp.]|nr:RagB/SusD family nutrient uptake outer membrane protein [Odoribacter sp.]